MLSKHHFNNLPTMKTESNPNGVAKTISIIALIIYTLSGTPLLGNQPQQDQPEHSFHLLLITGVDTLVLKGESEFLTTPSSYSINMNGDNGKCVIHMLNFNTPPGTATYHVEKTDIVRTAAICLLENSDQQERLASQSGTFTISEIGPKHIKGDFDMLLRGGVSGKEIRLIGKVTSENLPTNLYFNPN
jgi:hypothetical protein